MSNRLRSSYPVLREVSLVECIVYHRRSRRVQAGLYRLEGIPSSHRYYHAGVHLLINQKALSEPTTEIMAAHVEKVVVTSFFSCSLCRTLDDIAYTTLCERDERISISDVFRALVPVKICFDFRRQIGVSRLSTCTAGIFPPSGRAASSDRHHLFV